MVFSREKVLFSCASILVSKIRIIYLFQTGEYPVAQVGSIINLDFYLDLVN